MCHWSLQDWRISKIWCQELIAGSYFPWFQITAIEQIPKLSSWGYAGCWGKETRVLSSWHGGWSESCLSWSNIPSSFSNIFLNFTSALLSFKCSARVAGPLQHFSQKASSSAHGPRQGIFLALIEWSLPRKCRLVLFSTFLMTPFCNPIPTCSRKKERSCHCGLHTWCSCSYILISLWTSE